MTDTSKEILPLLQDSSVLADDFCAFLQDRSFLVVAGADRFKFLQGLISQDIYKIENQQDRGLIYSCLLTPQGKYLFDFFIFSEGEKLIIDCHQSQAESLLKKLSIYRLRSNIDLAIDSDRSVYALPPQSSQGMNDPRTALIGKRLYNSHGAEIKEIKTTASLDDYYDYLCRLAIPQHNDMAPEKSTVAELNLDQLNAIDWQKGCYMGQELTARVHYRGLVKRRLFPFFVKDKPQDIAEDMIIIDPETKQTIGDIRSFNTRIGFGMALMRLDGIKHNAQIKDSGVDIYIYKPQWS